MGLTAAAKCRLGRLHTQAVRRFYSLGKQSVADGSGSIYSAAQILRDRRRKKPLVILAAEADGQRLFHTLRENDLSYAVCLLRGPRPTAEDIGDMGRVYDQEGCDSIIALGSAPVMNAAKAVAVWAVRPKALAEERAYRRIWLRKVPVVITLPTAAGTGAESAAWIEVFDQDGGSRILAARAITPVVTILDPGLLEHTPRGEVAEAGFEGLCLAVEAYLTPGYGDKEAVMMAAEAVKGLLSNLASCWNDGGTPVRRNALLEASRKAGLAASCLGYGYARAMCREAGRAGIEPAEAYAVLLPLVLEKYGSYATEKLARLAAFSGVKTGGGQVERAAAFIQYIRDMAFRMGLPDGLEGMNGDVLELISFTAAKDVHCLPPVYWSENKCRKILESACAFQTD